MLSWLSIMSAAFGVSVLSAVLPLISIELFIVALMLNKPETSWWQLALVVASGQILGKLLYYFVAEARWAYRSSCTGRRSRPAAGRGD